MQYLEWNLLVEKIILLSAIMHVAQGVLIAADNSQTTVHGPQLT
jgi:hypothetical protein